MATSTTSGTITFPVSVGGPNASLVIGAPTVNPSSTSGPQITFTEQASNTYSVAAADATVSIPFGTITTGELIYIGSDEEITVKLNGSTDGITVDADGYLLLSGCNTTAITVAATLNTATVQVLILGA